MQNNGQDFLSAALLTDAVMNGIGSAGELAENVAYPHENALYSYMATQARLTFLEATVLSAAAEVGKTLPIEKLLELREKTELATGLAMLALGIIDNDRAAKIFNRTPHPEGGSTFNMIARALPYQKDPPPDDPQTIARAVETLVAYLKNRGSVP